MVDTIAIVECFKDGKLVATYDFKIPASLGAPPIPPSREYLENEAKTNLTSERLGHPPYAGFTFKIRFVPATAHGK